MILYYFMNRLQSYCSLSCTIPNTEELSFIFYLYKLTKHFFTVYVTSWGLTQDVYNYKPGYISFKFCTSIFLLPLTVTGFSYCIYYYLYYK